jgi:predicted nucleotidyltransferase
MRGSTVSSMGSSSWRSVGARERRDDVEEHFAPQEILAALDRHQVRYVVIGGLAAILHGAAHVTTDVDIVPEEALRNLKRLSAALQELNARIRVAGEVEGVPFGHDAESLMRVRIWNLVTDRGNLDITFQPSGTYGYEDLRRDAVRMRVRGVDVPVAALADVIRSKEAAGRERDRAILPTLRRLLDQQKADER